MNEKISQLNSTTLATGDQIPIARGGQNFRVDVQSSINTASANALQKINNLSDLTNISLARTNIDVYSTTQIDNLIIDAGTF